MAPTLGNFSLDFGQDPYAQLPGETVQRPDGSSFVVPPGIMNPQQAAPLPTPQVPAFNPGTVNIRDPQSLAKLATDTSQAKYQAGAAQIATQGQAQNASIDKQEAVNASDAQGTQDIYKAHQDRTAQIQAEADSISRKTADWAMSNVDPNAVTNRMDTWEKLMLGISLAAGGFLAPDHGGENIALKSLNTIIDRDVASQKSNLERQGQGLKMLGEANREKAATENDSYKQALEHKNQLIALAMKQVALEAQRVTSPQQQAALMGLGSDLKDQLLKNGVELAKMGSAERVAQISAGPHYAETKEKAREYNTSLGMQGFKMGEEARHDVATEAAKAGKAGDLEPVNDPNTGAKIAMVPKDKAKEAQAMANDYAMVKQQIETVKKKMAALGDMDRHPSFGIEALKSSAMRDAESSAQTLKDQALALVRAIGDKGNMGQTLMTGMKAKIETNFGWTGTTDTSRIDSMSADIDDMFKKVMNGMSGGTSAADAVVQGSSTSGGASGVTATQTPQGTKFSF